MPPRKSNVSVTSNGLEEGTAETPAKQKDGMSVEVRVRIYSKSSRLHASAGSESTEVYDCQARQRSSPGQYADTEGCSPCSAQEHHCFCQLLRIDVSWPLLRVSKGALILPSHELDPPLPEHAANNAPSANEIASAAGKKTIQPQDVLVALKECELEGFADKLQAELSST